MSSVAESSGITQTRNACIASANNLSRKLYLPSEKEVEAVWTQYLENAELGKFSSADNADDMTRQEAYKDWCEGFGPRVLIMNHCAEKFDPASPMTTGCVLTYQSLPRKDSSFEAMIYCCGFHVDDSSEPEHFIGGPGMLYSFTQQLLVAYKRIAEDDKRLASMKPIEVDEKDLNKANRATIGTLKEKAEGGVVVIRAIMDALKGAGCKFMFVVDNPEAFFQGPESGKKEARATFLEFMELVTAHDVQILLASNTKVPEELYEGSTCILVQKGGPGWDSGAESSNDTD